MATRTAAIEVPKYHNDRVHIVSWVGLLNGDDGSPIAMAGSPDRSVQVLGTFGTGGTIVFEGSNDGGTTYFTLTDPQGNAISKTAAAGEQVVELTGLVRPRVTAGDGTTNLKCYLLLKLSK